MMFSLYYNRLLVTGIFLLLNKIIFCEDYEPTSTFYEDAIKYWQNVNGTVESMIGDSRNTSEIDIEHTRKFLNVILKMRNPPGRKYVLDCASGIGRVTDQVLVHYFEKVDLLDQNPDFLKVAKDTLRYPEKIGLYIPLGLQQFTPEENKYDAIWCQWAVNQLTDKDAIAFLKRAFKALKNNGILFIKDNISICNHSMFFEKVSALLRTSDRYKSLAKKAGFTCIKEEKQLGFPKYLGPVKSFAFRKRNGCDDPKLISGFLQLHDCQCY